MANDTQWDLYRCFLRVLQEGSLSAAARSLGMTQPTAGRQISALEEQLGVSLFTRSQSGLAPTDAALALRGHVEAMQSMAASAARVAGGFGHSASGCVRISASEIVGVEWLPPILAALRRDHPQLEVELVLSNRVQDLVLREVDIAVRMAPPQQDVLLATRVGHVRVGLYARRDYLARRGVPAQIEDLAQHDLIGFDMETPFLRAARTRYPMWTRENFALRSDSDLAQLALVRAGAGIGSCQVGVAKRDESLVRVLPALIDYPLDAWVAMHADLRSSASCRVAFEVLVSGLRAAFEHPGLPPAGI